jgi:hypothetical protein
MKMAVFVALHSADGWSESQEGQKSNIIKPHSLKTYYKIKTV